jgi:hypothetical protein
MADIKGLEKEYKKSQVLVLKALKNNSVAAYQLFEAKQKEGIPLVNPVKKRERKEKKEKVAKIHNEAKPEKIKKPKVSKAVKDPSEPARKRGRPAQPKKTE